MILILLDILYPHFLLMEMFSETIQFTCQNLRGSSLGYTHYHYHISSVTLTVPFAFKCVQIPTPACKSSVLHYSMKLYRQELSMSESVDLGIRIFLFNISQAECCCLLSVILAFSHLISFNVKA